MSFEESLRWPGRFETAHPALALPRRLMRVFRPVVEVTTLAMNDSRENDFLRRSLAAELISDDHARLPFRGTQELPEK